MTAFAAVAYEGPARQLVRALKFSAALGVAPAMAAAMVAGAPEGLLAPGSALVPVPLHPRRARRRGFNQAEVLARAVAWRTGLPVAPVLGRRGGAESQVGRDRGQRERALRGSVSVRQGVRAPPRAVLVDDVITTGATLAGCAAALRAAGSGEVRGRGLRADSRPVSTHPFRLPGPATTIESSSPNRRFEEARCASRSRAATT